MRLAVIADTHIPVRALDLPPGAWQEITACDGVLHAGDVMTPAFFAKLRERSAQVWAVRGNNDRDPALASLPERIVADFDGVRVAMIHDSGDARGRRERMRRAFPEARVVIYGHSHIPVIEDDGELLLLNPGSPTDRRRMPSFTMAVLEVSGGEAHAAIVDLGLERARV